MASSGASIEIQSARLFRGRAVLIVCTFGMVLAAPVLLSMLVVSIFQFSIWTMVIPLLAICTATFFLPFGFGNSYVGKLARSLRPADWKEKDCFIVQITLVPRLHTGFRALLEDADDIGSLRFTESGLAFWGDSVRISIPYSQLSQVRLQSIGWRGLFLYPAVAIPVSELSGVREVHIAERAGLSLPRSRDITRKLYFRLTEVGPGRPPLASNP